MRKPRSILTSLSKFDKCTISFQPKLRPRSVLAVWDLSVWHSPEIFVFADLSEHLFEPLRFNFLPGCIAKNRYYGMIDFLIWTGPQRKTTLKSQKKPKVNVRAFWVVLLPFKYWQFLVHPYWQTSGSPLVANVLGPGHDSGGFLENFPGVVKIFRILELIDSQGLIKFFPQSKNLKIQQEIFQRIYWITASFWKSFPGFPNKGEFHYFGR